MDIQKIFLWDGSVGRKTSEKQVKDSNSWAVPCCSTRHVTYGLPPLRSTICVPVADDPPLPPCPIPDGKLIDVSSQVKDLNTPATTTDDEDNPTEVSSQVKDSNYIIVHSEDLNAWIREQVTCNACTMR